MITPSEADLAHIVVFGWACDALTPSDILQCASVNAAVRFLLNSDRGRWAMREEVPIWPAEKWVMSEDKGLRMWINLNDPHVSFGILHGTWEMHEVDFMKSQLRDGDGMVDVGANLGVYSLAACQAVGASGRVYSFEPMPRTSQMLRRNVLENGFGHQCEVFETAIGFDPHSSREGVTVRFIMETSNPGASRVSDDHGRGGIDVTLRSLDSFTFDRRIAFLKIDIEGNEVSFLKGARQSLLDHRPLLLTEFYPRALKEVGGSSGASYVGDLCDLGYSCFEFDAGFGKPVTRESAGSYSETADPINLLCRMD